MFSLKVIDTDEFMDMPQSTQLLYYNLAMRADDDGFVASPKKIMKISGSNDDDMKVLGVKKYVIPFESGVCVIRHWRIHNYIQSDRYESTQYIKEREELAVKDGKYDLKNECIQNVSNMDTQVRLGKVRLGKERESTPAQEAREFFEGKNEEILNDFIGRGIDNNILRAESQKFILYWTEKNKSGTKQRWEQQPTFEVRRRLATWLGKMKDYKTKSNQPNYVL